MKLTKEQLDTIKNAKNKEEAWKERKATRKTAREEYKVIPNITWKAYYNWEPPKEKDGK